MENKKVIHKVFYAVTLATVAFLAPQVPVSADENTTFNVNVEESLSVSVTTPSTWASGNIDTFLRNKVSVSVTSNNTAGFTASMTTKTADTALTNTAKSSYTLPTLSGAVEKNSFPANYWGYSLNDTDAGNNSSTYNALVGAGSTPITILSSANASTGSKDFYFGAKADVTQASGTYMGTVVISVVSGVIDSTNPITPTNPVTPGENQTPVYNSGSNTTAYTYSSTNSGTTSTTTQVSKGDNRSAYEGYTPPQGVTHSTKTATNTGTDLATGLGIAAAVAATSGLLLFVAARRENDEDDEDNE